MVYKIQDVTIVIPNWNGSELLKKNLPSVIKAAKGANIVVVDDGSTDNSVEVLEKNFPTVKIIKKQKNEGFAHTVNTGVDAAKTEIVVLLNTDIEPESNFLESLLPHFTQEEIFAVGCLDKSEEGKTYTFRGRGIASWQRGFYIHRKGDITSSNTAWVSGGSGAFRKSLWKKLGGMDTLYSPFYWEDIDLSYRARKAGYVVLFESKSVVIHRHEEGKIKSSFSSQDIKKIAYRNQFIFIWKNLSDPFIWFSHAVWLPIRLIQALIHGELQMISGYVAAVLLLPQILRHRALQSHYWRLKDSDIR